MKVAVVCANGRVGTLVVKEAVERGLDVTAIVRGENKTAAKKVIQLSLIHIFPWLILLSIKDFCLRLLWYCWLILWKLRV